MYDYLIVGSGFFGSTFARLATDDGKKCLVLDKRSHIGGNAYSSRTLDIDVHQYGPHIFHTNSKDIWSFVNKFSEFNNFILTPKSFVNGRLYSLPFNMNTFQEIWNIIKPDDAKAIIEKQKFKGIPSNLEEQALSLVGKEIYDLLIKGYTQKQWKKEPKDLPSFIIKRLPVRYTYDNNYFNDRYQGIPVDGYDKLFERMLDGIDVQLNTDFLSDREYLTRMTKRVVYTGKIDEYFDYEYGDLEYRGLSFVHEKLDVENYQGTAMVNYPSLDVPWTRIVEHKHFTGVSSKYTIITKEYPVSCGRNDIPYYPINDEKNNTNYTKYKEKAANESNVIFGGRLSEYMYYDMHQVIGSAMAKYRKEKDYK
jgi:UDP-galactopyranose mutase